MKNIKKNLWLILIIYLFLALTVYPKAGFIALICMFAPLIVAPFIGRKWCGFFCPRGSFIDEVINKISRHKNIPDFMLKPYFRWLVFVLLMGFFTSQVVKAWGDWNKIGLVIAGMVLFTTIIATIIGIIWRPRTWCTAMCPIGTLSNLLSTFSKNKLVFDSSCVSCNICSKNCPMQLNTSQFKKEGRVTDPRCIKCGECIKSCPKDALNFSNKINLKKNM